MAAPAEELPILPANFFHSQEATHWSWERDFTDVLEIGKGKVRRLGRRVQQRSGPATWVHTLEQDRLCARCPGAVQVCSASEVAPTRRAAPMHGALSLRASPHCLPHFCRCRTP